MTIVQDFLSLLAGSITIFAMANRSGLIASCVIGIVLAAVCWTGCSYYSRLWNLRYRVTITHHLLCGLAAILTFMFTVLFAALAYTRQAALVSVQVWEGQVNLDRVWANSTFANAYAKVKNLGLEDFSNAPPPGAGGTRIPTVNERSIMVAASTYAEAAAQHFVINRPFLSKIVQGRVDVPTQTLDSDVKNYFATVSKSYPPLRGISLVARAIKQDLDLQVPRVARTFRTLCIVLFAVSQLIPFGLVGYAAYRDLKVAS
jgi:hypothetical protein